MRSCSNAQGGDAACAAGALADTQPDEVAAILFTSGSTGVPKGVVYRHRHFVAQVEMLREAFGIEPGGVDLPTFPPFALFDPALGLTSVIPDMDPDAARAGRSAQADRCDPALRRHQMFGSPALLDAMLEPLRRASRHALPSLNACSRPARRYRRPWSAHAGDAARRRADLDALRRHRMPAGGGHRRPRAACHARAHRSRRRHLRRPPGRAQLRAHHPHRRRADLPAWHEALVAAPGAVGEITVAGPSATDEYFRRPPPARWPRSANACPTAAARRASHGRPRLFRCEGRLWFCGRKTQRVETPDGALYTEQVEPVFNTHAEVRSARRWSASARAARRRAVLCVELERGVPDSARERIEAELLNLGARLPHTARVQTVRFHPGFPVDIRHNAKIGREQLARWATGRLGERSA
jgi:acyl-coenzyme A synthetase/AMP-(fatty) acid ligase